MVAFQKIRKKRGPTPSWANETRVVEGMTFWWVTEQVWSLID